MERRRDLLVTICFGNFALYIFITVDIVCDSSNAVGDVELPGDVDAQLYGANGLWTVILSHTDIRKWRNDHVCIDDTFFGLVQESVDD